MGGRRDDSAPGPLRGWPLLALLLTALATAAVFFVELLALRVGLLAVCWALLIGALLAGRRRADQVAAAAREAELRQAYDRELEREVAARHGYEVELEGRVRQETEDAMREELAQLRAELAGLADLRADVAALGQLRSEIAALTEIRRELAGLSQLRTELAGLGALRDDLARLRTELTEQLSGELLIERMVMRAQSVRGPAVEPGDDRTLEGSPSWDVDRWEETRVVPALPVEAGPRLVPEPPPVPPPSPLEWLGGRSLLDDACRSTGEPVAAHPEPAPRRHRRVAEEQPATAAPSPSYDGAAYDDLLFGNLPAVPASEVPAQRSTASGTPAHGSTAFAAPAYEPSAHEPAAAGQPEPQGHARLEQILADSGVQVPSGGRSRRRRYRDEDDGTTGDDVLARVLGR